MILTYQICVLLVATLVFFLKITLKFDGAFGFIFEVLGKAAGKLIPLFVMVVTIMSMCGFKF